MQAPTPSDRFIFLDYLRAIAAWAVVYDHMTEQWIEPHGVHLRIVDWVRSYVFAPLGIIQDTGWLAVCLFFLVSGFVITHVASRETAVEFGIKRLFRIFPMLALAVLVILASDPVLRAHVSLLDILRCITLVNYLHAPQVIIVGVAWTLIIEVTFYILTMLTMSLKRRWLALAVNLAVSVTTIRYAREFGADFFLFAAGMAYVPYLIIGQIAYLSMHANYLARPATIASLLICFGAIIFGILTIHTAFLPVANSYLINFLYALAIFSIFILNSHRLAQSRLVSFFADTSYAVYLVHGIIGPSIFAWTYAAFGARIAIVSTLAAITVTSYALHIAFEKPMIALGRRLSAGYRAVPSA